MWSRWWAQIAGAPSSTSRWTAKAPSTFAAISSWATRRSRRLGSISISHEAQFAGNAAGNALHRQRVLIDIGRHQIAGLPGKEQKDGVIGLVRKTILRIAGGDQLACFRVITGGDEFGDTLVLCRLEQGDFRHRDRGAHRQGGHLQRGNADQKRFLVGREGADRKST